MRINSSTEFATLHHCRTSFKVTNTPWGLSMHSTQLQQAVQAHSPALNIPSHPMLVQQLQSRAISSHYKHSVLNHIFSLSCLHLRPQSSKIQGLCRLKYTAKTFLHSQRTPFLCCNQNNLSHPAIVWGFFISSCQVLPFEIQMMGVSCPASYSTCNKAVFSWISLYLTFPVQARHRFLSLQMLILQLFQHDSLTSINRAFASLTNLRSHLIFLHFCWTRRQPPPTTSVTTEMELFLA